MMVSVFFNLQLADVNVTLKTHYCHPYNLVPRIMVLKVVFKAEGSMDMNDA